MGPFGPAELAAGPAVEEFVGPEGPWDCGARWPVMPVEPVGPGGFGEPGAPGGPGGPGGPVGRGSPWARWARWGMGLEPVGPEPVRL